MDKKQTEDRKLKVCMKVGETERRLNKERNEEAK
jgi:hypothetical protein